MFLLFSLLCISNISFFLSLTTLLNVSSVVHRRYISLTSLLAEWNGRYECRLSTACAINGDVNLGGKEL